MTYKIEGKEVEYKTVSFLVKSVDQDQGIVTGLASPLTIDLQKDQVESGAYKKTLTEAEARMKNGRRFMYATLWMHEPTQPTGGVVSGQETPDGLLVTMKYDISTNAAGIPNNPIATMVFSGFKVGYIDELSIGYVAVKYDYDKQGVRHLREIQLIEISGVTMLFAANPEALVPASGVKTMASNDTDNKEKPVQRKDFNDLFIAAQAADCLEDWCDLTNTITQTMLQIFGMGDSPQSDMADCLEQFSAAVNKWLGDAVACNLGQYINDQGYCNQGTPHVPYSLRTGSDYGYMARATPLQGSKAGRAISAATQGTLQAHQEGMKAHLDAMQTEMKGMQQKVSDLTQLWKDTDQGDAYDNDKSRTTRREPPQTLARRDTQPLHKSTVNDDVVAELEALFN